MLLLGPNVSRRAGGRLSIQPAARSATLSQLSLPQGPLGRLQDAGRLTRALQPAWASLPGFPHHPPPSPGSLHPQGSPGATPDHAFSPPSPQVLQERGMEAEDGTEVGAEQENRSFSGLQTPPSEGGAGSQVTHTPPLGPPGSQGPRRLCLQPRPLLRAPPAHPPPCSSGWVSQTPVST